jgi:hypothetical protein
MADVRAPASAFPPGRVSRRVTCVRCRSAHRRLRVLPKAAFSPALLIVPVKMTRNATRAQWNGMRVTHAAAVCAIVCTCWTKAAGACSESACAWGLSRVCSRCGDGLAQAPQGAFPPHAPQSRFLLATRVCPLYWRRLHDVVCLHDVVWCKEELT